MAMTVRTLTNEDRTAWEQLASRSAGVDSFGLRWSVGAAYREIHRVGVFSDSELCAGAVLVERRVRGLSVLRHPAPAPFGGVLLPDDAQGESALRARLEALGSYLANSPFHQAELIMHPSLTDVRGLLWSAPGWRAQPHYNYVSEIGEAGALLKGAESGVRKEHRAAVEAGLRLETGFASLAPQVVALWKATRERQGVGVWTPDSTLAALAALEAPGPTVALVRNADGVAVSGAIIGHDRGRAYYLVGGNDLDDRGAAKGAATFLQCELTDRLFAARGPFLWDWVGANTPSVVQFKKKFRPRLEVSMRLFHRSRLARWVGL